MNNYIYIYTTCIQQYEYIVRISILNYIYTMINTNLAFSLPAATAAAAAIKP